MRPVSQMDHMRRGSAQSIHSDMGNGGPHHRGGYPYQGRGRGNPNNYGGQYNQQQPYSPGTASFQPNGPNRRGNYQNYNASRGGGPHQGPYPGSPSMAPRTPAYPNANPGTPTMGQMQMVPGMHGQYQGYPQMGGQQVNRQFSSSQSNPPRGKAGGGRSRGATTRGRREGTTDTGRGGRQTGFAANFSDPTVDPPRFVSQPLVPFSLVPADLSPESGNFERILTGGTQNYLQFQGDPSINYMQEMQRQNAYGHQPQYPGYGPPQSPRPNFTPNPQAAYMQQSYSNQGHQPQSMSRQSSQMSMPDRPGSTVGHVPTPSMTPATAQSHTASRAPSVSAPKMNEFQVPRKSKAIAIVNPNTKDVVKVEKPVASPATPAPAKTATPPVPTPSPKIVDPSHNRTDSVNVKSKEELQKAMQEAVARKIAEDKAKAQPEQAEKETPKEETVVPEINIPAPAAAEKTTESKADETVVPEVKVTESAVQDQDKESPAAVPAPAAEDELTSMPLRLKWLLKKLKRPGRKKSTQRRELLRKRHSARKRKRRRLRTKLI